MTVTGFWHGGITVADMAASHRFYVDLLGLRLVADRTTRSSTSSRSDDDVTLSMRDSSSASRLSLGVRVSIAQRSACSAGKTPSLT